MGGDNRGTRWDGMYISFNVRDLRLNLITIHFPQIYAGLTFRISISFPANYPYVAPTLKFETPCYHPNVDINGGAICLDILQVCGKLDLQMLPTVTDMLSSG